MKIAICQINTIPADLEGNVDVCLSAINQVMVDQPDLIVLPEMALCGYHPLDILHDPSFVEALQEANQDFATLTKEFPPILFGSLSPQEIPFEKQSKLFNCAFFTHQGKLDIVAQQQILWDFDIHFDSRWFSPGRIQKHIQLQHIHILPLVGKDFFKRSQQGKEWFVLANIKPDLVISLSNLAFSPKYSKDRYSCVSNCECPVILVNQVGANDAIILDGNSIYHHPHTKTTVVLHQFKTDIKTIQFPHETSSKNYLSSLEEQWAQAIQLGIRDFFQKNHLQHAFIGLSGGIDSAVVTWLTMQALGKENLTALLLPSQFNHPKSTQVAKEFCEQLGIKHQTISIEPFYNLFAQNLSDLWMKESVSENLQPRLRMLILMAYVNFYGGVLINTSNKTELTLGYGTMYGDLAGSLSPIGDLTKPQVYQLAYWINTQGNIIPSFILNRKPSAELKPNQVDPFDYSVISPELETILENNQSNPLMRTTEHKRQQFGTILRLSEKSFGLGRLIPITRR